MKLFTVLSLFLSVAVALPADGTAPSAAVSLAEPTTPVESAAPTQTVDDLYKTACLNKYKYYVEHFKCGKPGKNPQCETVARKHVCIWNPVRLSES